MASRRVLEAAGCNVLLLPVIGAGRTLISKGFLQAARSHAKSVLDAIEHCDQTGEMAVLGIEPSEIYTLRDEYLDLLPEDLRVKRLAKRAYMIDEYLVRRRNSVGNPRIMRIADQFKNFSQEKVLLHGHCYQKAQPPAEDGYPFGVSATIEMLETLGYEVELIQAGCCGMAGAFGYETEHYEISQKVGELGVFPAARSADQATIVAASGVSCKEQIQDAVSRKVVHPIELVFRQI
jgi:Fe-S oxidoreductase